MGQEHPSPSTQLGTASGLAAAVLFGLSPPLLKLLLPTMPLLMLAALLYLSAGLGLTLYRLASPSIRPHPTEAKLRRADLPLLIGVLVAGGIAGPLLMLVGLSRVSGTAGALLLNLEAPLTILLAVSAFREYFSAREALGALVIVAGAAVLVVPGGDVQAEPLGVLALAGACAAWGVDNNLTQRLSVRDPIQIVQVKAVGAGTCNLAAALFLGQHLPEPSVLLLAAMVGMACYGASIVLDVYALRALGAAREAALFATAPFVGALAAIPLLKESPSLVKAVAMVVMALGVALLVRSRHAHSHAHEALEHDHLHAHDEHHQHSHLEPVPQEPHSHTHRHAPLTHDHPHASDAHHRHGH